jgi:DNA-binding NarL/FixJ family response regulator
MLKKTVTIIDTDKDFRDSISNLLMNSEGFLLNKVYDDTVIALKRLLRDRPDIILMDLKFTELQGIDFIFKVRERAPWIKIFVLTTNEDHQIAIQAITQGASGYLYKKNYKRDLMEALNNISNGGSPIDPFLAGHVIRSIQINVTSPLSNREAMIVNQLIQGKTNTRIATDLILSNETVKTHIRNIYRKLNVKSKAQALRKAVDQQLVSGHLGVIFNTNKRIPKCVTSGALYPKNEYHVTNLIAEES